MVKFCCEFAVTVVVSVDANAVCGLWCQTFALKDCVRRFRTAGVDLNCDDLYGDDVFKYLFSCLCEWSVQVVVNVESAVYEVVSGMIVVV